jgi:hypothetical protein
MRVSFHLYLIYYKTNFNIILASPTMGNGSLSREYGGRGMALTTHPINIEVKERVEVYMYFPFGASWPVLG